MADGITVKFDPARLMQAFAALRGIPIAKVVRNAARDFVSGAFRQVPLATKSKAEYAYFRQGGKKRFLRIEHLSERDQKRLRRHELKKQPIRKGFARSTWKTIFQAVGIPPRGGRTFFASAVLGNVSDHLAQERPAVTITNWTDWRAASQLGVNDRLAAAGFGRASNILARAFAREVAKAWK